ncbi:MAG: rRNA maturation RNase YbeY [Acidimicrobiia bacterium]|nr:MAG: rRNA maturation RNase YbeY [Acidimicrobiia bacterium]
MIVDFGDEQDVPVVADALVHLADLVMTEEGLPAGTGVSITLVDEQAIASLNREHMGKTGPTDVLSFPIEDAAPGMPPQQIVGGPPIEIGDVVIAPSVVRSNAERDAVAFEDELALMVVHGVLHLLGWDHVVEADAVAMERREEELLNLIGKVRV